MMIDWLIQTTLDITLLIALVLLLRPIVLRTLGAKVTYWLWSLPLVRAFLPDLPERNGTVLEAIGVPEENISANLVPLPDLTAMPLSVPWQTIWLVGICVWIGMRVVTWYRFRQALLERASVYPLSDSIKSALSKKIQWSEDKIQFFLCTSASAPFVTGLSRPSIYLPQDFNSRFTAEEQVWVLVHELSHVRRKDLWVQGLGECIRAVFWFNPAVHFGAQVMQQDQEMACDHSVLSRCSNNERYQYGKALMAGVGPHLVPSVMTFFSKSKERFTMLSKHKVSKIQSILGVSLCVVISVIALTKAPSSIAQNGLIKNEKISLNFKQIPLINVVQIIANFSKVEIFNWDFIDKSLVISIQQDNVPAIKVLERALQCGGYDYIEYESGIELIQSPTFTREGEIICVVNLDGAVTIKADKINIAKANGVTAVGRQVTINNE